MPRIRPLAPIALSLLLSGLAAAQVTWEKQAPLPVGLELNMVHMLSPQEAWIAGDAYVGDDAVVLHTLDGGVTWDVRDLPTTSLEGIFFLDPLHGWACGNAFFHTVDGGQTWIKDNDWGSVYDIYFVDSLHGWACGNGGTTYRTTDGGRTWSYQTVGPITTLSTVFFHDQNVGWTASIDGKIYKSTDGGQTWILNASTGGANLTIQFLAPLEGWAIGGSTFFHTTNGGSSWQQVSVPSGTWVYDAFFADAQHGWALGGKSVRTVDGGQTWQVMPEAFSYEYLWSIQFTDASIGMYVGATGIIERSTDGGVTWSSRQSGGAGTTHGLDAVDELHAWAANDGGEVLYTTDGGAFWQRVYVPGVDTYGRMNDVDFVDATTGWSVGKSSSFGGDVGVIVRSTDGGATFQLQKNFGDTIDAVAAIDAQTAFVVGTFYTNRGFVLRTRNGGASWVDVSPSGAFNSDVEFVDASSGWVVGPAIFHTADGGATWDTQFTGHGSIDYLESISMADALHGWAVGWFDTALYTDDGGATWTPQTLPPGWVNVFLAVHAVDADTAWVTGGGGYVAHTTDGGQTWTKEVPAAGFQYSFEAAHFLDADRGWISGTSVYPDGGIYFRSDGSASAHFRNAGANPASYAATTLPVLGTTYVGTVDLAGTTGHSLAWLVGYASPLSATLAGGQVLLVNAFDAGGELLLQPAKSGPLATFGVPVPSDVSYVGFRISTQALHVGGVTPFALSNAQDLRLGS